jgi:hypothetical protein
MKTAFLALLSIASIGASLISVSAQAQSISELPALSKLIVHHYDCRIALLPSSGASKELNFQISPNVSGHDSNDFILAQGADKIVASASAQMLQIVWTRNNQTVANAQAWIQNSATQALVLIVSDPADDSTQAHLNCSAVTFDQVNQAKGDLK